jgi:hypothetical protein
MRNERTQKMRASVMQMLTLTKPSATAYEICRGRPIWGLVSEGLREGRGRTLRMRTKWKGASSLAG